MFNKTHFEHTVIALVLQMLLGIWIDPLIAGAIVISGFFGREYAQVEYKVREATGITLTDMMPWSVFDYKYWSLDNLLDFLIPAIACYLSAVYVIGV